MRTEALCPNIEDHTFSPEGYIERSYWAERMAKTHRQRKCPGCGRYAIWEPKRPTPPNRTDDGGEGL